MMTTASELKSVLWTSAEMLRDVLSSAEHVPYLGALMLIKRLSDQASGTDEIRGSSTVRFDVPHSARWGNIESTYGRIGEALLEAGRALEEANPELRGIFRGVEFLRIPSGTLRQLVHLFSGLSLHDKDLVEPGVLGIAFESLLLRLHPGIDSSTPPAVRRIVVGLARLTPDASIHDPACGTGGMLAEAASYLARQSQHRVDPKLSGQERNVSVWELCKMNMIFHGVHADVRLGDTLRAPQFTEFGKLARFDRILCNPPMGTMNWTAGAPEDDPFARFSFGLPPKRSLTLAFVQHIYSALTDGGLAVVVVPMGTLFREGAESRIREQMLEQSVIEAIIGLPGNPAPHPAVPSALLILRKRLDQPRREAVLMMDARRRPAREPGSVPDVFSPVISAYEERGLSPVCRWVAWEELQANRFNLNLGLYLPPDNEAEQPDLEVLREEVFRLEGEREALARELHDHLDALRPYLPS